MSTTETNVNSGIGDAGIREADRHSELRDYERAEAATIERDIDATRADVRATLAALERRLSFDRLVELTIGRIRERGGEFAGNLTDTATQNPMPVLLTSIGLAWMMLTSRRSNGAAGAGDGRMRARAEDAAEGLSSAADRASSGIASAADRVSSTAHGIGERLHEAGARLHEAVGSSRESLGARAESMRATAESMRYGASRAAAATREQAAYASERFERLLHEQPLLIGALGLAAGALIGALLPATEAEGRMIGELRDKAVKNVERKGRSMYESARESAAAFVAPNADTSAEERPSRPH